MLLWVFRGGVLFSYVCDKGVLVLFWFLISTFCRHVWVEGRWKRNLRFLSAATQHVMWWIRSAIRSVEACRGEVVCLFFLPGSSSDHPSEQCLR